MDAVLQGGIWSGMRSTSPAFSVSWPASRADNTAGCASRSYLTIPSFAGFMPRFERSAAPASSIEFQPSAVSEVLQSKYAELQARLRAYSDRWVGHMDADDAIGTAKESLAEAESSLALFLAFGVPVPKPMISDEGVLSVYWRAAGRYASIDFEPDGHCTYAIADGQHVQTGTWDRTTQWTPPAHFLDALPEG